MMTISQPKCKYNNRGSYARIFLYVFNTSQFFDLWSKKISHEICRLVSISFALMKGKRLEARVLPHLKVTVSANDQEYPVQYQTASKTLRDCAYAQGHLFTYDVVKLIQRLFSTFMNDALCFVYQGHIRLTDFGLCKEGVQGGRNVTANTFCGTPEVHIYRPTVQPHYAQLRSHL